MTALLQPPRTRRRARPAKETQTQKLTRQLLDVCNPNSVAEPSSAPARQTQQEPSVHWLKPFLSLARGSQAQRVQAAPEDEAQVACDARERSRPSTPIPWSRLRVASGPAASSTALVVEGNCEKSAGDALLPAETERDARRIPVEPCSRLLQTAAMLRTPLGVASKRLAAAACGTDREGQRLEEHPTKETRTPSHASSAPSQPPLADGALDKLRKQTKEIISVLKPTAGLLIGGRNDSTGTSNAYQVAYTSIRQSMVKNSLAAHAPTPHVKQQQVYHPNNVPDSVRKSLLREVRSHLDSSTTYRDRDASITMTGGAQTPSGKAGVASSAGAFPRFSVMILGDEAPLSRCCASPLFLDFDVVHGLAISCSGADCPDALLFAGELSTCFRASVWGKWVRFNGGMFPAPLCIENHGRIPVPVSLSRKSPEDLPALALLPMPERDAPDHVDSPPFVYEDLSHVSEETDLSHVDENPAGQKLQERLQNTADAVAELEQVETEMIQLAQIEADAREIQEADLEREIGIAGEEMTQLALIEADVRELQEADLEREVGIAGEDDSSRLELEAQADAEIPGTWNDQESRVDDLFLPARQAEGGDVGSFSGEATADDVALSVLGSETLDLHHEEKASAWHDGNANSLVDLVRNQLPDRAIRRGSGRTAERRRFNTKDFHTWQSAGSETPRKGTKDRPPSSRSRKDSTTWQSEGSDTPRQTLERPQSQQTQATGYELDDLRELQSDAGSPSHSRPTTPSQYAVRLVSAAPAQSATSYRLASPPPSPTPSPTAGRPRTSTLYGTLYGSAGQKWRQLKPTGRQKSRNVNFTFPSALVLAGPPTSEQASRPLTASALQRPSPKPGVPVRHRRGSH